MIENRTKYALRKYRSRIQKWLLKKINILNFKNYNFMNREDI
jgi:hypothetical protein